MSLGFSVTFSVFLLIDITLVFDILSVMNDIVKPKRIVSDVPKNEYHM